MKIITRLHAIITDFITREFTENPHGLDGVLTITAIRLVAGMAYIAFALLAFWLVAAIITFILANFGAIILTLTGITVSYFVGMLVIRRVIEINANKTPPVEVSPAIEAAA